MINQIDDKIVYLGVININENGKTIGAVDIWRSVLTKEVFCEEKRLGVLEISEYIGMPRLEPDQQWAVVINKRRSGKDRWKLIKIVRQGDFTFIDNDDETKVHVKVMNYQVMDEEWWSFLVSDKVNRTVDVMSEARNR
ncbi:MAG: hypothetical protein M3530_08175 [Thermoproteota archaeon]|nr:hypothetical protein [Thermoproteota archaeon]